jgi:rubrerythrin
MADLDREKVIKGLEEAYKVIEDYVPGRYRGYSRLACCDAIDLLREQETTFVLEPDRYQHYHCEKCGYVTGIIARMHKFCPECGRKVLWHG